MRLLTTATSNDEANRAAAVAVLPVGSFEQHGAHLPLITDTVVACAIAEAVVDAYGLYLLPPVTISCSHEHSSWPGTVSISARTLAAVIGDIVASLERSGVAKLVLVNGHGGNYALSNSVQEANVDGPRVTLFPTRSDWEAARAVAGLGTSAHTDMHAGELETSLLLHVWPEIVRPGYESADHVADDRPHLLVHGMRAYTASGVVGRPSLASGDKGKAILGSLTASFASHLRALSGQVAGGDACAST